MIRHLGIGSSPMNSGDIGIKASERRVWRLCSKQHIWSVFAKKPGLRSKAGTVVHSDRGSEFRSKALVRTLKNNNLVGSIGRAGTCGDNAAMESFFALLQKNVLDRKRWESREELRLEIITWIERTYPRRHRQRGLGRLTPIEFEILHTALQAA
jgi:transposase InsO family protein